MRISGQALPDLARDMLLVLGVAVAVQEADADRLDAVAAKLAHQLARCRARFGRLPTEPSAYDALVDVNECSGPTSGSGNSICGSYMS